MDVDTKSKKCYSYILNIKIYKNFIPWYMGEVNKELFVSFIFIQR